MEKQYLSLEDALRKYDRSIDRKDVELAEQERQEILRRFPLDAWPGMSLDQYAIGRPNYKETYGWLIEFGATHLGSMKGGTARKHLIYWQNKGGWYFDRTAYTSEDEAWAAIRAAFVEAFERARRDEWDTIDQIEALNGGAALRVKTLCAYFPQGLLPVCSMAHVRHFLELLGDPAAKESGYEVVRLNRVLLTRLRQIHELRDWSTKELERFLYFWSSPVEDRRIVKIAPGRNAVYWDDCLRNGFICVGWEKIGDLRQYESKDAYLADYEGAYADIHGGHKAAISKQANELWTLRELEPGDLIVANKGVSVVLGVGEVVEPGYEFLDERPEYKHVVHVKWDTSKAGPIPPQKQWLSTVQRVPPPLVHLILGRSGGAAPPITDPLWTGLADALERKGQAILYGPPGTGKTFAARRFAVWWLLKKQGEDANGRLTDPEQFRAAEARLTDSTSDKPGQLTLVTFHASYSYEDFVEGIRPVENKDGSVSLRLEPGIFKRLCRQAQQNPDKTYLMLIDEINRANVAKVFGELVTLLERDKRGLPIVLPQSKQPFTIPNNLYLLGTMNTADRSIKLLDAALRRRFAFIELMPDSTLLRGKVRNLAVDDFLDELNRRIAQREGREKQIGHSFLLDGTGPVTEPKEFARRFRQEILPLLQEFCYEDYTVLAKYIGAKLVDAKAQLLDDEILGDPERLLDALESEFGAPGGGE